MTAELPPEGAPLTGLSHVQLLVTDVPASATWYSAALGLEPYAEDPAIGYIALRHRMSKLVVVLTPSPTPGSGGTHDQAGAVSTGGGGAFLDHLAFAVPDGDALRVWADHLTEIGIDHQGVVPENGNPSLQLRDPDGIAIELVAPGRRRP
jgi:glyoxylase I family protein